MGFNFGAFAGGLSEGVASGIKMGKSIRDVIREREKEDMLKQAREEAGKAYDAQNAAAGGLPAASNATPATPATQAPAQAPAAVAEDAPAQSYPVPAPPPAAAAPLASPESAAASLPPSVATQTPAPTVQPTPQQIEAAVKKPDAPAEPTPAPSATPQAAAAAGVPAPVAATPAVPAQPVKPDPQSRSDFIQKEMGRRAYDYFVGIGDLDTAEKWRAASESAGQRAVMRDWAKAYTAPDFDSMLDRFGKFYTDHVNDGVDYKTHEIVNRDGQQIGVITLKDKATGKEQKLELTQDKVMQMAEANNPAALFASESKKQALMAASKQKLQEKAAETKLKAAETVYKEDRADAREKIKQDGQAARDERTGQRKISEITLKSQLDAANLGAKAKAEARAKIDMLKESGRTDEEVNALMPSILGVGDHKKTTDPAERRALILSDLTKNDPTFSRLSEEAKAKKVDESMRVVYGGEAAKTSSKADAKPTDSAQSQAPVIVRDKKTGQVGRLEGGKFVPMSTQPAAAPPPTAAPAEAPKPAAAAGLPPAPAAPQAPTRIPDPPPETVAIGAGRGTSLMPNPAYAEWAKKYDPKAYAAQRAAAQAEASKQVNQYRVR